MYLCSLHVEIKMFLMFWVKCSIISKRLHLTAFYYVAAGSLPRSHGHSALHTVPGFLLPALCLELQEPCRHGLGNTWTFNAFLKKPSYGGQPQTRGKHCNTNKQKQIKTMLGNWGRIFKGTITHSSRYTGGKTISFPYPSGFLGWSNNQIDIRQIYWGKKSLIWMYINGDFKKYAT